MKKNEKLEMSRDFWKKHIEAGGKHAAGIRAYCEENKISHSQYYNWKSKLLVLNGTKQRFVPAKLEMTEITKNMPPLPDARWLAHFTVELIRGLHR